MLNRASQQRGFEAILDDRAAGKGALVHRIPYRETVGVILAAKKQGPMPQPSPSVTE